MDDSIVRITADLYVGNNVRLNDSTGKDVAIEIDIIRLGMSETLYAGENGLYMKGMARPVEFEARTSTGIKKCTGVFKDSEGKPYAPLQMQGSERFLEWNKDIIERKVARLHEYLLSQKKTEE